MDNNISAVECLVQGRPLHQVFAGSWLGEYLTRIYNREDLQAVCDKKVGNHWVTEVETKVGGL